VRSRITRDDLLKIAALAKINLNEQEIERYAADLNAIVDYAERLQKLDVTDVEPMISPIFGQSSPLKEDIVKSSLSQADALKGASQTESGYFRVPKTLEG
jgi:aspartyl-tRNA(Asn)/glutamyl-tRNA(Gln) amidotransferase subunit C